MTAREMRFKERTEPPKVTPLERIHPDGTREQGFVVIDAGHERMEAPFFARLGDAIAHADDIAARRRMGAVAL